MVDGFCLPASLREGVGIPNKNSDGTKEWKQITLTIIVVVTVIIALVKIMAKAGPFPTTSFIIWVVMSIILIGMTNWSWLRNKEK
jgi:hypothetical protein